MTGLDSRTLSWGGRFSEAMARLKIEPVCRVLGVSASAYYQRATGGRSPRRVEDAHLLERIHDLHEAATRPPATGGCGPPSGRTISSGEFSAVDLVHHGDELAVIECIGLVQPHPPTREHRRYATGRVCLARPWG